jgi:hypothetical protein
MFTYSTLQNIEYSSKGTNISVSEKSLKTETLAVIGAVSFE